MIKINLYRAMSLEEFQKTKIQPSFNKKNKWFSLSLDHIKRRIQDGKFNNSSFVKDKYNHIVKFTIDKINLEHFINCGNNELMLNVRKINLVKWYEIGEIKMGGASSF